MTTKLLIICAIFLASIASTLIYQTHHEAQQEAAARAESALIMAGPCASPCPIPSEDLPQYRTEAKQ
jgi:hypothetical protein